MVDNTSLDASHQIDLTGNAIKGYDLVATNSVISQGTLIVDGNATINGTLTKAGSASSGVSIAAATSAPTAAQTGSIFILNRAAGSTVTLPTPVVGTTYKFIVGTALSSASYKIITSAGTVFLTGGVYIDKALTITRYDGDGSTHVSLNLNGSTTGGATVGDAVTFTCVSATEWTVEGTLTASGTLATPFATS